MRASTRVSPKPKPSRARATPARTPPRQERSRATVDVILDATARSLRQHGYDDTTTNRIAEIAGVSVGSLYQYFRNKPDLVVALIERHNAEMWAVFSDHATRAIGRPFALAIPALIDALFAAHLVDPALHRVLHQQIPRVGALAILEATYARSHALVLEMLRTRTDQHRQHDDPETAALVVTEAVEALIHASLQLPPARAKALQRHASQLVLGYLGVTSA
jgi:AcrR family transcriptional regulator